MHGKILEKKKKKMLSGHIIICNEIIHQKQLQQQ